MREAAGIEQVNTAITQMDVPDDFKTYFMREISRPAQRVVDVCSQKS